MVVVVVLDDDGVEDEGSERKIAKSRTRNRMNLPAQPFILRSAVVPFDQFIQGFKTFLRARPPGFVSLPVSFSSVDHHHSCSRLVLSFATFCSRCSYAIRRHVSAIFCADDGSCRSSYERFELIRIAFYNLAASSRNVVRLLSIVNPSGSPAFIFYFQLSSANPPPGLNEVNVSPCHRVMEIESKS